jgi:hypothetical protein
MNFVAGDDNRELACSCCVRISEHWCGHITLSAIMMRARKLGRGCGADRAHREMGRAGRQAIGKSTSAFASEKDFSDRVVVGQHADNASAIGEVGHIHGGGHPERLQLVHLLGATDVGGHRKSGGDQVCRHCGAHKPKAQEANLGERELIS